MQINQLFVLYLILMYEETTNGIAIRVTPSYLEEKSNPALNFFLFSYKISITNHTFKVCKLLNRFWTIRNGDGREEKVFGKGVVGETPDISPGESFEYESFCPLNCPYGNMRGQFEFITEDQEVFRASIPLFFLRPS